MIRKAIEDCGNVDWELLTTEQHAEIDEAVGKIQKAAASPYTLPAALLMAQRLAIRLTTLAESLPPGIGKLGS